MKTITTFIKVMIKEAMKRPSLHRSYEVLVKDGSGAAVLSSYRLRISMDRARNKMLTKSYM